MSQEGLWEEGKGALGLLRARLSGGILGPVLVYETSNETLQNGEGLCGRRGFCRRPPGDVVAAGTWGKAGGGGGCCSLKEEDLPKLPEISSELRVTQP